MNFSHDSVILFSRLIRCEEIDFLGDIMGALASGRGNLFLAGE